MLIRTLLDLLFPPRCILCHEFLPHSREPVCDDCAAYVLSRPVCLRQGRVPCLAPLPYEGRVRQSLKRYKFQGRSFYAETYGAWLAAALGRNPDLLPDMICWVPVSRKRKRRRGYDQAELLARSVARELQIPVCACLKKLRDNPPQSGISSRQQRRKNVMGVYAPLQPERFSGKRLLLVDDILTTGATMEECGRVLRRAGAADVMGGTLAMKN